MNSTTEAGSCSEADPFIKESSSCRLLEVRISREPVSASSKSARGLLPIRHHRKNREPIRVNVRKRCRIGWTGYDAVYRSWRDPKSFKVTQLSRVGNAYAWPRRGARLPTRYIPIPLQADVLLLEPPGEKLKDRCVPERLFPAANTEIGWVLMRYVAD